MPVKGKNKGALTQEISSSPACLCLDDDDTKLPKNRGKISKPLTFFHHLLLEYLQTEPQDLKKQTNKQTTNTAHVDTEDLEKFTKSNETITSISIFFFQYKSYD